MMNNEKLRIKWVAVGVLTLFSFVLYAQVPKPSDVFGFKPGADYKLASYDQMLDYYEKLDSNSDRVKKIEIGKTTQGRPMVLLLISSKENLEKLDYWKDISSKLAKARIDSIEAQKLSNDGKAVVWIDGGMHSNELAPAQMTSLLAYKLVSENTPEMDKIRKNVILLLMPNMNPDGLEMWRNWYYKNLNTSYEATPAMPWLYQKYVGHDNNRDWFMANMKETKNVLKVLYEDWFPQIVYNHHQPGQGKHWERIVIPPFRSPVNQNIHPEITAGTSILGSEMMQRFAKKNMPGAMAQTSYSMFWNGGMRTVPYYHNMIGLLSEVTHGSPTPQYYDPKRKPKTIKNHKTDSTSIFYPYPWQGGWSHFRDAVDYSYTASMAVLNYAADRHNKLLKDIYDMGRKSIEQGKKETPFAYIITSEQWDSYEADNLVDILLRGGIEVQKATEGFFVDGQKYKQGAYIIYASQAFRAYLDLLEPQKYPDQYEYSGGPPKVPYDLAGWTLPLQMGVNVDRINKSFKATTKQVTELIGAKDTRIQGKGNYGYIFYNKSNVSVKVVNELFKEGVEISRIKSELNYQKKKFIAGSYIIENVDKDLLEKLSRKYGIAFYGLSSEPDIDVMEIKAPNVGIYYSWRGKTDEGWTRWLLQQDYGFEVDSLHNEQIELNNLEQYHSIILPSQSKASLYNGYSIRKMPEKYTGGLGVNGTKSLEEYTKKGGTLIAFDKASDYVIEQFNLPIKNVVKGLNKETFFIPGSLLKSRIDTKNPLAWGMQDTVNVAFGKSRAFRPSKQYLRGHSGKLEKDPSLKVNLDTIAQYVDKESELLSSGWMLGGRRITNKLGMIQIPYGEGKIILFGFRPQFRGQTRGTYKLIFNALYNSTETK